MSELLLRRRALMAAKIRLPDFDLLSQPGLSIAFANQYNTVGDASQFVLTGDPIQAYGKQGANSNNSFSVVIPKEYKTLQIDIESGGRNGYYNYCSLSIVSAFGVTGYFPDDYLGERFKLVDILKWPRIPEQIASQPGVVIMPASTYSLPRQIVSVDISDISQDCYLNFSHCDNWTRIYSIKATERSIT